MVDPYEPPGGSPVITSALDLGAVAHKPTRDALRQAAAGTRHGPVWILDRNGKRIGALVSIPDAAFAERARKDAAKLAPGMPGPCPPVEMVEVTREEGMAMLDRGARYELGIGGEEFLRRCDAGEYDECAHTGLRMLIPFAREVPVLACGHGRIPDQLCPHCAGIGTEPQ